MRQAFSNKERNKHDSREHEEFNKEIHSEVYDGSRKAASQWRENLREKLFGRHKEVTELLRLFHEVSNTATSSKKADSLVMISGPSGSG